MFTGLAFLESLTVTNAVNAGISLSTVLNVQALFQLTVLCICIKEAEKVTKISSVFAILRVTATTSIKAGCALDSGLEIVLDTVEVMTPTLDTNQCPGSLLKKFLNLRLRSRDKASIPAERLKLLKLLHITRFSFNFSMWALCIFRLLMLNKWQKDSVEKNVVACLFLHTGFENWKTQERKRLNIPNFSTNFGRFKS